MSSRLSNLTTSADTSRERVRNAISGFSRPDVGGFLWPADRTPTLRITRLLALPWWIGADVPGAMPRARAHVAAPTTAVEQRLLGLLTVVRRRQVLFRYGTMLFRSLALTLLIGIIWVLIALAGGPALNASVLTIAGIALTLVGLAWGWWTRPGLRETATMLDRSFALSDRLTTAVDSIGNPRSAPGEPMAISDLQQIEAINVLAILNRRRELGLHAPWREIVRCVGLGLLFLALYLLNGTGGGLPAVQSGSVPAFVPAKDRLKPTEKPVVATTAVAATNQTVQDVQQSADVSLSAQQDLLTLADALDNNPLTAPIADAIRAGDYARAAAELAAVAGQVDQQSPDVKAQLAADLEKATAAMTGENPDLQSAATDAAKDLKGDDSAAPALNDLGDQIEQTGGLVKAPEDLAGQMTEAREAQTDNASRDTRPEDPSNQDQQSGSEQQQTAGEGGDAAAGSNEGQPSQDQQAGSGNQSSSADSSSQSSGDSTGQSQTEQGPAASGSEAGSGKTSGNTGTSDSQDPGTQPGNSSGNSPAGSSKIDPVDPSTDGQSGNSQPGTGAGKGDGESQTNRPADSNGANQGAGNRDSEAPSSDVTTGESGNPTDTNSDVAAPSDSITLSRSPDAPGYKSGGASSSSSGSGSGAAAGAGSVEQGDVGDAGPDSNRVPDQYKTIVQEYFTDGP